MLTLPFVVSTLSIGWPAKLSNWIAVVEFAPGLIDMAAVPVYVELEIAEPA